MFDVSDAELQKSSRPFHVHKRRSWMGWTLAAAVAVAAGTAWFYFTSQREEPTGAPPSAETTQAPQGRALGGPADRVDVPPLDEADPLVRMLVSGLSSHPVVAAWLATDDRIRNFVVVVENIAYGASPARHLAPLRPRGPFRAIERNEEILIDPRSYDRYAPVAAAVDSIEAAGAARVYTILKPRIEEAYAELGRGGSFDAALERAIVDVLRTPVLIGDVALAPRGIVFGFDDPELERLTAPQKQLARMGPANVRLIQAKLRAIGLALGIPSERLN